MKQQHRLPISLLFVLLIIASLVVVASARVEANQSTVFPDQRQSAAVAVTWLYQEAQNEDGGFGIDFGTGLPVSSVTTTLDAVLAISAAGYSAGKPYFDAEKSAIDYLDDNAADVITYAEIDGGTNGKIVLALSAANENARDFAGQDFVAQLLGKYESSGDYNCTDGTGYCQALAMLALSAVGETVPEKGIGWLEELQDDDGSWSDGFGTDQNVDATALAVMALLANGREIGDKSVADALDFLESSRLSSGGWEYGAGYGENANSTALAIQALSAAGENFYESSQTDAVTVSPMDALLSWQNSTGAFQADFGQGEMDNLFATLQAVPAVTGKPYPLPSHYQSAQEAIVCLAGLQDVTTGGWEQFAGFGVSAAGTSRAIEAIAAAGGDAQSADWTPGSVNAVEALENGTPAYLMEGRGGRVGIVMQGVVSAGEPYDVTDFAGRDLPQDVADNLLPDGTYADTSFGVMAQSEAMLGLLASGNDVDPTAVDYLLYSHKQGDWGGPDSNGAAMNVLGRLGIPVSQAVSFAMSTQQADAGWGFGGPTDPSATSEIVQGLVQQGENPFSPEWSKLVDGKMVNPADAIMALQQENGCWPNQYGPGDDPFGTTDSVLLLTQAPAHKTHSNMMPVIVYK